MEKSCSLKNFSSVSLWLQSSLFGFCTRGSNFIACVSDGPRLRSPDPDGEGGGVRARRQQHGRRWPRQAAVAEEPQLGGEAGTVSPDATWEDDLAFPILAADTASWYCYNVIWRLWESHWRWSQNFFFFSPEQWRFSRTCWIRANVLVLFYIPRVPLSARKAQPGGALSTQLWFLSLGVVWQKDQLHPLPGRHVHGGLHPGTGRQVRLRPKKNIFTKLLSNIQPKLSYSRHPSNLMLDRLSGKILHIDFGDCFEVRADIFSVSSTHCERKSIGEWTPLWPLTGCHD